MVVHALKPGFWAQGRVGGEVKGGDPWTPQGRGFVQGAHVCIPKLIWAT